MKRCFGVVCALNLTILSGASVSGHNEVPLASLCLLHGRFILKVCLLPLSSFLQKENTLFLSLCLVRIVLFCFDFVVVDDDVLTVAQGSPEIAL